MRKVTSVLALCLAFIGTAHAQLAPPQSPSTKIEQRVGLTDITLKYSRPSKRDRVVFGDVVPYGEVWRTGANENTTITFSDGVVFGKDSLKAGTYAVYTKPGKDNWEVIFYKDYSNWGNPEEWKESNVALRVNAKPVLLKETIETFTIGIESIQSGGAKLVFAWDKTVVAVPFTVPTEAKVMANIKKTMGGPSGNDYFGAAQYYHENKKDLKQALEWVNKGIELRPDAFWMVRLKALIQADMGDKAQAIETAKVALELAQKADNQDYVRMLNASIAEWSKK